MNSTDARHTLCTIRAGLAGFPVSHSLSPRLFAAAAKQCGLECRYELLQCRPEDFADTVEDCRQRGLQGISVTTPHKRQAWELADSHSAEARLCGNANLLLFRDDGIHAANTDVHGFSQSLTGIHGCDPAGAQAVILGTGSVARSVLLALSRLKCDRVLVAGRNEESLQRFARESESCRAEMPVKHALIDSAEMNNALIVAKLVVNCTSAGMAGDEDESPLGGCYACRRDMLALDLVYHPPVTRFIAQMRNCGARTENGLAMLACQAAEAFELLCGHDVDAGLLLAGLEDN